APAAAPRAAAPAARAPGALAGPRLRPRRPPAGPPRAGGGAPLGARGRLRRPPAAGGEAAAQPRGRPGATAAGWLYLALGAAFAASLVATCRRFPLVPLQPRSASWSFAWLLQTIWDYYATALCLCGVVIATEGWMAGTLWSLGILLLGSSFSCAYVALRLLRRGTLALRAKPGAP
ncbi:unnamed protein product, partial [Prorocentrum cordatum]